MFASIYNPQTYVQLNLKNNLILYIKMEVLEYSEYCVQIIEVGEVSSWNVEHWEQTQIVDSEPPMERQFELFRLRDFP